MSEPAPQSYDVHRLGPVDVGRMRDLNRLFGEAFQEPQTYTGDPPTSDYLRDLLARDQVIVLIALEAEQLIGGLVAYEMDKFEQARREVYIYDLAVDAGRRRRGVATALIERLCDIARTRGAWTVFVQADYGDDPAIALYEKLGEREEVLHFDLNLAPQP